LRQGVGEEHFGEAVGLGGRWQLWCDMILRQNVPIDGRPPPACKTLL
jgi:hypothetical protein